MTNILAIARKELRSYFASPIAYIVIGFWSLLYGYFFVAILSFFVRQSLQMNQFGMQGPQSMNVNQQLLRLTGPLHFEPHEESDRRRHGDLRGVPAPVDHHVDRQLFRADRRQDHA